MKTLDLHYPTIQFLLRAYTSWHVWTTCLERSSEKRSYEKSCIWSEWLFSVKDAVVIPYCNFLFFLKKKEKTSGFSNNSNNYKLTHRLALIKLRPKFLTISICEDNRRQISYIACTKKKFLFFIRLFWSAKIRPYSKWIVLCQPRRWRILYSLQWHAHWRWRLDRLSEKTRWLGRFLSGMERLQSRLWSADRWVLVRKRQNPPTDGL